MIGSARAILPTATGHAAFGTARRPDDVCTVAIEDDLIVMNLWNGEYEALIGEARRLTALSLRQSDSDEPGQIRGGDDRLHNVANDGRRSADGPRSLADLDRPTRPSWRDWGLLLVCAVTSWFMLTRSPQRWKRWHASHFDENVVDESDVVHLVATFRTAILLIPGVRLCLANTMLLSAFLRRHGIRATWVFGVRTYPFEAHCWLEWQDIVLNDTPDHVRWFTPIMVM